MFLRKKKELRQAAGDGAVMVQAGRDVTVYGMSYSETRSLVVDLVEQQAPRLAEQAIAVASARAETFARELIQELYWELGPRAAEVLADPAIRDSIFHAQRAFAASGDEELGSVLVSILVERAATDEPFLTLIQNNAVNIAPLLNESHWNALSALFVVQELLPTTEDVNDLDTLAQFLSTLLKPFLDDLPPNDKQFRHLVQTGCASGIQKQSLAAHLKRKLGWLFAKPVPVIEIMEIDRGATSLLDTCVQVPSCMQFSKASFMNLRREADRLGYSFEVYSRLRELCDASLVSDKDVSTAMQNTMSNFLHIQDVWDNTALCEMELFPVGMAIASANLARCLGTRVDLTRLLS
jgi:hypothetical protein